MDNELHDILIDPALTSAGHPNTVALIGVVLTALAGLMCIWMFVEAGDVAAAVAKSGQVPDPADQTQVVPANSLQILLIASTAAMLNIVGLALSIVGLFLPRRPRTLAVTGVIGGTLLLFGVFGTIAVGALLQPA